MASIIKRRNKFSVVYRFVDENGVQRQRWETFNTNAEAKKRKSEVEFQQDSGTFIVRLPRRWMIFSENTCQYTV
jgi:hypothetical protein